MSAKKKTNLYIDGTNLFAGQNELFGQNKHLSFSFLIQEIKKLVPVDNIFFYASYMNQKNRTKLTEDRKRLIAAEALFYREVRNTKSVTCYRGHRSPTSGKEKGVDVHLSVDIVKDIFLPNRFSLEMAYKVDAAFVLNFSNKFRTDKNYLGN